jgi:hypothetical protein
MAYSDFKNLTKIKRLFEINIEENKNIFSEVKSLEITNYLKQTLEENLPLASAINTEKARSELIIAPILLEIRRYFKYQIGFFSGTEFSVDQEKGLNGYCDYILTASNELYLNFPL